MKDILRYKCQYCNEGYCYFTEQCNAQVYIENDISLCGNNNY